MIRVQYIYLRAKYDTLTLLSGVLVMMAKVVLINVCEKSTNWDRSKDVEKPPIEASTYPSLTSASIPKYVIVLLPFCNWTSILNCKKQK